MLNVARDPFSLPGMFLGAALAVAIAASPAAAEHETLSEILGRWQPYVDQYKDAPREERVTESKKFFLTIPWDNIEYLCLAGSPGVGPDSTAVLRYLMTYRLEVGPPPVAAMAPLIANPDHVMECRVPLMGWVFQHRDELSPEDRRLLAAAHLAAAEFPGEEAVVDKCYVGAAALVASDSLMGGMMAWGRSGDELLAGRAVRMLTSSADPRSPDSLAALAQVLFDERSPALDVALVQCRGRCQEAAYPVFISAFQNPRSSEQEVTALEAAARVPRVETAQAILDHYADGGVIADSTFTSAGEARVHYYGLWIATRVAEPHLLSWLREGNERAADLAIELLDRSLRFGPPDKDPEVVAALDAFAERTPAAKAERARAIRARALDPPQSRKRPDGASPPGVLPPGAAAPEGATAPVVPTPGDSAGTPRSRP